MHTHVQNFARIKTAFLQPQHLLSQSLRKCLKVSKLSVYLNLRDFFYLSLTLKSLPFWQTKWNLKNTMHILCSYIKTISEMEEKEEGRVVKSNI